MLELGYNREIGAFTQALGSKDLDATALAVAMYEMLPATDPRVVSTVKVLREKLSNKGFLYRYVPEESEFHQPEGVFIICTLWLVNVLAQMGRIDEAEALFSRVTETANDLGLFAEEFDPETGEMLGNFPQALTHLSVINAALNLEGRPSGKVPRRWTGGTPGCWSRPVMRASSRKRATASASSAYSERMSLTATSRSSVTSIAR